MVMPPLEGGTVLASGMSGAVPVAPLAYSLNNMAYLTPPAVSAGAVAYGVATTGPLYGPSLGLGSVGV